MTTLAVLPPPVRSYLSGFVSRLRLFTLLRALAVSMSFTLSWMLFACLLDRMLHLHGWVRAGLLVMNAIGVIGLLQAPVWAAFRRRVDWLAAAAEVERRDAGFAQRLQTVTSQLLSAPGYRGSEQILQHLADEVARQAATRHPAELIPSRSIVRPGMIALGAFLLFLALMLSSWLNLPRLVLRYAAPLSGVAPVTTTWISVFPGNADVMQGASIEISAETKHLGRDLLKLNLSRDSRQWTTTTMARSGEGRFTFTINSVERDLQYNVSGGDARSETYVVRALRPPAVTEFRIRYVYPDYTERAPLTVTNTDGVVEAPVDTVAHLSILASEALQSAELEVAGQTIPMTPAIEPGVYQAKVPVTKDGPYHLRMISERGVPGNGPASMAIRAIPDRPPLARLLHPASDLRLRPRDILGLQYLAMDDYGVVELSLRAQVNGRDALSAPIPLRGDRRRQEGVYEVDLATLPLEIGDIVSLVISASDRSGHSAVTEPRYVLMSPQSIDLNTHLRIAELGAALRSVTAMVSEWDTAVKAIEEARNRAEPESEAWARALADATRSFASAGELATITRMTLLRTIIRGGEPQLSVALATMVDEVQQQSGWANHLLMLFDHEIVRDSSARDHAQRRLENARQLQSRLQILLYGEQAAALLAERHNLAASEEKAKASPESAKRLDKAILRAREDISTGVRMIGLDPNAGDLDRRLKGVIEVSAKELRSFKAVDYAGAAREWSRGLPGRDAPSLLDQRLATASQAEAIRLDSDMIRAHDLQLASQAASAIGKRAARLASTEAQKLDEVREYPGAMAALQAEHVMNRAEKPPKSQEAEQIRKAAAEARGKMSAWAEPAAAIAHAEPTTESELTQAESDGDLPQGEVEVARMESPVTDPTERLAMEANARMAERNYDQAESIDQRLATSAESEADSPHSSERRQAMAKASDRMESAKQVDQLIEKQHQLRQQTQAVQEKQAAEAANDAEDGAWREARGIAEEQAALAESIGETRERWEEGESARMDESPGRDTRREAVAAIGAAQARLAAMPEQINTARRTARQRGEASARAQATRSAADTAPPEQAAAARRTAEQAAHQFAEAQSHLDRAADSVAPGVAEAMARRLEAFAPETTASTAAVDQQLTPALRMMEQAMKARDAGDIDRAATRAREAIEVVQNELRRAQDALMEQDPLVSADWYARAAAAALKQEPPDLRMAAMHQENVSAALGKAWNAASQQAASARLSGAPSMGWLFSLGVELENGVAGVGGVEAILPDVPSVREWGRLLHRAPQDLNISTRDNDPPGYQESLKLYFEALGQTERKK